MIMKKNYNIFMTLVKLHQNSINQLGIKNHYKMRHPYKKYENLIKIMILLNNKTKIIEKKIVFNKKILTYFLV